MKYKMIVADCDDTILNSELSYSQHFRDTLHEYLSKGGKFVIATGRMTSSVLPYCYDLGLTGEVITYQGAVTADILTGKTLSITQITYKDAFELAEYIEQLGYYYHIYDGDCFYTKEVAPESQRYAKFVNSDYKALGYNTSTFIKNNKICPTKMMIITDSRKIMPLIKHLTQKFPQRFLFNTSKKWMVEIVPSTINKGIAVAKLAEKYGIKREEVICIGDSLNDIAMIEYAGLGVAMGNGSIEAKQSADIIAPSNDDDGVAYIINKYGFLE